MIDHSLFKKPAQIQAERQTQIEQPVQEATIPPTGISAVPGGFATSTTTPAQGVIGSKPYANPFVNPLVLNDKPEPKRNGNYRMMQDSLRDPEEHFRGKVIAVDRTYPRSVNLPLPIECVGGGLCRGSGTLLIKAGAPPKYAQYLGPEDTQLLIDCPDCKEEMQRRWDDVIISMLGKDA